MKDHSIKYEIKPRGSFSINLNELWQYRELFYFFTWRDIKVKYKQTVLGFIWAILQPLLMMSVFVVFFSKGLKLSTDHIPAPIFYFSGLLFWNLFSSGLSDAANSMVANAGIIKKVYFPRLIIPLSAVLVALFDFIMASLVYIFLILYFKFTMSSFNLPVKGIPFFFISLVITIITTAGAGMMLAAWNVKYRDFRYIIPFTIQFLLFLTPVIYPVSLFENIAVAKYLLALNPMTGAIMLIRSVFAPGALDMAVIGISSAVSVILLLTGLYFFNRMQAYFADIA